MENSFNRKYKEDIRMSKKVPQSIFLLLLIGYGSIGAAGLSFGFDFGITTTPSESQAKVLPDTTKKPDLLLLPFRPEQMTIKFRIQVPYSILGPDAGPHTKHCRVAMRNDEIALIVQTEYQEPVRYHAPGTNGATADHDDQGNMLLSRSVLKRAHKTATGNLLVDEQERTIVSPEGIVISKRRGMTGYLFPIDSLDSIYEVDQLLLTTGRGFHDKISSILEVVDLGDDSLRIIATGNYGPSLPGKWTLEMGAGTPPELVREASFEIPTQSGPCIKIHNSGVVSNQEFALAKEGKRVSEIGTRYEYTLQFHVDKILDEAAADLFLGARGESLLTAVV